MKKKVDWKIIPILVLAVSVSVMGKMANFELTPKEELGKALFFDKLSSPNSMACATCHAPEAGWTGDVGGINVHGSVNRGAIPFRFGNRKPSSAAYATQSPKFKYNKTMGQFVGGNFWDGRATGEILGSPAADQALGPFLGGFEQNNPSKLAVLEQIANSKYTELWEQVWEPISLEPEDTNKTYNNIGLSIAAYEASEEVNQFSSKYDAYLSGTVKLTEQESDGMKLYNTKGKCKGCHPSGGDPALFTNYTFHNLGVPRNPENPFYKMDTVYLDDGSAINPDGIAWVDIGLAGFLKTRSEYESQVNMNEGKHKVPTLRNVDKRYGESFPKAYSHNGYFKSLKSIVHFYNTRDTLPKCVDEFTTEKDALKMGCWPVAEVTDNVNTTMLGNLELSDAEEDAIVAFLKTLSDGYNIKKNK